MRIRSDLLATLVFVALTNGVLWSQQSQSVDLRINLVYAFSQATGGSGQPSAETRNNSGDGEQVRGALATMQIRVQVLNSDGTTVSEQSPDSEGHVRIRVLSYVVINGQRISAIYRLRVFGPDIEEVSLENIEPGAGDSMLNVQIHRRESKNRVAKGEAMVSASTLKIPSKALKELEKGNETLGKNDYEQAAAHFQKAVDIYPEFDQAWNNLGVVKMKMGDAEGGKAAFEKALEANDKFARAYVNLARIDMKNQDYAKASERAAKSLSIEPLNAEALSIACESALLEGKTAEVTNASVKLHSLPHEGFALCHYAAGVAYTNLNKPAEAVKEYQLFLMESPNTPLVAKARLAIQELGQHVPQQK